VVSKKYKNYGQNHTALTSNNKVTTISAILTTRVLFLI